MQPRLVGFASMLVVTMAMSTFALFAFAVIASELEVEFGLSKFQLGLLGAVNTGVGGVFAPAAGRLTDLIGARRAMGAVLAWSALTLGLAALAQSYVFLLIALGLAGVNQGWGNPATNKAISTGVELRYRGVVTGVKQSGVQLAVFLAGIAMPAITAWAGWRTGLWMAAGVSLAAMLGLVAITDLDGAPPTRTHPAERPTGPLPVFVVQVAVYGFLLGTVGGALGRFLPLYAEESIGFSPELAGLVFAVSGLVAIPTRIASGVLLDRGVSARRTLAIMAVGSGVAFLLILAAADGRGTLLWLGVVVSGMTLGSWNTAANLSMVRENAGAGRASGVLMLGFLIGLTLGAPLAGWSIDRFDGYGPAWIACAIGSLAGAVAVARRPQTRSVA